MIIDDLELGLGLLLVVVGTGGRQGDNMFLHIDGGVSGRGRDDDRCLVKDAFK